jgi:hypothetical protein
MENFRLSRGLCALVGNLLMGSHPTLDALFVSSGAPGEPPDLAHHSKWKEWLFRAGQAEEVDSLKVMGNVLEEFMDVPPIDSDARAEWKSNRELVVEALELEGLRYFRGGRILPNGEAEDAPNSNKTTRSKTRKPESVEELLNILIRGLPRAVFPLQHRRKGSQSLSFDSEYDVQDLLHALLRPWISDVRPEEFTPSYAGSSTRMDFLLPEHNLVIETKIVRSKQHGLKVGDELIIDIDHHKAHPDCSKLWCVIYDPNHFIQNPGGLVSDLSGMSKNNKGEVQTSVFIRLIPFAPAAPDLVRSGLPIYNVLVLFYLCQPDGKTTNPCPARRSTPGFLMRKRVRIIWRNIVGLRASCVLPVALLHKPA